ncbi:hypothetical protein Tco_1565355 [Tanacetum coccineum]
MQEVILFYNGLDVPTRQILDSKDDIPSKTVADAKIAIQEMAEYSQKWHNGTSSRTRSIETSDQKSDANYARDHTIQKIIYKKKKGKLWKKPTIYSSVHPINLEDSIEQQGQDSTNEIMEILRDPSFNDAAIRNEEASIKTLEIQIGQMIKVLQERGFGSLPISMKTNPRDQVKSISTAKADFSKIHRIGHEPYAVSGTQHKSLFSKTFPFPRRLQKFGCDDWIEAQNVKILDTYDHSLP